ncbi:hypothetical protein [Arthrobacter sp. PM3]|uniref:hypothetical protein n=1 Tax=Arthrobacter sp. PM3 TaxID=2017685 RepID=UPI000E10CC0C|nr:hypothetical protein [Arthrobacter sp. PM3]AXJ10095.1 hypothetical protein CFN17_11010 [Arthrobacter sp. PM3]
MKKIITKNRRAAENSIPLRASTGSHCPANGLWRTEDASAEPVFVFEGSIMPAAGGMSAVWYLDGTPGSYSRS